MSVTSLGDVQEDEWKQNEVKEFDDIKSIW